MNTSFDPSSFDPFAGLSFLGLNFKNPIVTASGTFNFGREYAHLYDLSELGGLTTKGTSLHPRAGNPTPRVAETPAGMLNAIGLENKGVEHYVTDELPWLRESFDTKVIVNVFGETPAEFAAVASRLGRWPHLLELNLSCPNVHGGALPFASDPKATEAVVRAVKDATDLPVIVKLSPNTDHLRTAQAAEAAGANGFSLINTILAAKIDTRTGRSALAYGTGGLSGPAVLPVAVRMVMQLARATSLPILGMGGVAGADDALQLAMAGATLVAVGTATFTNPIAPLEIARGLRDRLTAEGRSWGDVVGLALRP